MRNERTFKQTLEFARKNNIWPRELQAADSTRFAMEYCDEKQDIFEDVATWVFKMLISFDDPQSDKIAVVCIRNYKDICDDKLGFLDIMQMAEEIVL